jgi:hypothetical protein
MTELLQAAVLPPNLLPTGLLVFVLLYWLTVIVGLLDLKTVDLSIEDHGHLHFDSDCPARWSWHQLAQRRAGLLSTWAASR